QISGSMAENRDIAREWGTTFANLLTGIISYTHDAVQAIENLNSAVSSLPAAAYGAIQPFRALGQAILQAFTLPGDLVGALERQLIQHGSDVRGGGSVIGGQAGGVLPSIQIPHLGGGGGGRGGGGRSQKDDTVERARKLADDRLKVQQEKDKAQLAELKLMLEEGTITEQEEIQKRQEIEERFFDYKIGILKKEMDLIKGNAKETARLNTEITLTSLQKVVQVSKDKIEVLKQEAKEAQNNAAIWEQIVKREIELRGQALELEQHQLDVSKQL